MIIDTAKLKDILKEKKKIQLYNAENENEREYILEKFYNYDKYISEIELLSNNLIS